MAIVLLHKVCSIYLILSKICIKILPLFRRGLSGFDLWSCVSSVRVASYFATLHRATTTPTRNDLSKLTPEQLNLLKIWVTRK